MGDDLQGGNLDMIIVQALVTALLSGLFSGAIVFALNERRDRQRLLLEKAELAVVAYSEWVEDIPNWIFTHHRMFGADREAGRQEALAGYKELTTKYHKASMLVAIYLPNEMDALLKTTASYHPFMESRRLALAASDQGGAAPEGFSDHMSSIADAVIIASYEGIRDLTLAARRQAHAPHIVRWPNIDWRRSKNATLP